MTRQEIIAEMKQTLGVTPDWFTSFPDHVLTHVWGAMRDFQLGQTTLPNKYKELIGLGVAAQMQCPYCIYFHTEAARFFGASDQEIKEALSMTMMTAGLSSYIAGTGYDLSKFKQEVTAILKHVGSQMPKTKAA